MSGIKGSIEQGLVKALGKVRTAPTVSQFLSHGVLTPDEFIEAGDLLCYKCPAWTWESSSDPSKRVSYLPSNKQFLITRKAPCSTRASDVELEATKASYLPIQIDGDDGWVCEEESSSNPIIPEVIPDANSNRKSANNAMTHNNDDDDKDDDDDDSDGDIPDMEGYDEENVVDPHALISPSSTTTASASGSDHLVAQRHYDISITYDNYYNCPRMWLFGYDEKGHPLSAQNIFDDISEDHARKTVTVDTHPFLASQTHAYIHPCKHSSVMKSMLERMVAHGKTPRVDHYLFVFLKFMSSVIPTIEYDISPELSL